MHDPASVRAELRNSKAISTARSASKDRPCLRCGLFSWLVCREMKKILETDQFVALPHPHTPPGNEFLAWHCHRPKGLAHKTDPAGQTLLRWKRLAFKELRISHEGLEGLAAWAQTAPLEMVYTPRVWSNKPRRQQLWMWEVYIISWTMGVCNVGGGAAIPRKRQQGRPPFLIFRYRLEGKNGDIPCRSLRGERMPE